MVSDYLEHATVYFWNESGSFSAESERTALVEHRPNPGRRSAGTRNHRCGGSGARPATSDTPRRHP